MEGLEKYLPIGSVVMLKGGTKRLMIIGLCAVTETDKNKMWDYSGCLYPEGVLTSKQTCVFNHEQIEKIYHLGLIDDDEINFKKQMKEFINKINENTQKAEAQNGEVKAEENITENTENI